MDHYGSANNYAVMTVHLEAEARSIGDHGKVRSIGCDGRRANACEGGTRTDRIVGRSELDRTGRPSHLQQRPTITSAQGARLGGYAPVGNRTGNAQADEIVCVGARSLGPECKTHPAPADQYVRS